MKCLRLYPPLYSFYKTILIRLLYTFACAVPIACNVQTLVRMTGGRGGRVGRNGMGQRGGKLQTTGERQFTASLQSGMVCCPDML